MSTDIYANIYDKKNGQIFNIWATLHTNRDKIFGVVVEEPGTSKKRNIVTWIFHIFPACTKAAFLLATAA